MWKIVCLVMLLPSGTMAEADPQAVAMLNRCLTGERQGSDAHICIGRLSTPCMEQDGGFSTAGMASCTLDETAAWDVLLNRYYGEARTLAQSLDAATDAAFSSYAVRAETLRDAQRAWITFCDTNCAAEYAQAGEGTIRQLYGASCHLHMTAERTIWLFNYTQSVQ